MLYLSLLSCKRRPTPYGHLPQLQAVFFQSSLHLGSCCTLNIHLEACFNTNTILSACLSQMHSIHTPNLSQRYQMCTEQEVACYMYVWFLFFDVHMCICLLCGIRQICFLMVVWTDKLNLHLSVFPVFRQDLIVLPANYTAN